MNEKRLLNNMTPGSKRAGLGDRLIALEEQVAGLPTQATAIADSEEATNPTVAEFNALLAALRASGAIASE